MEQLDFCTMDGPDLVQRISLGGVYRVQADRDYRVSHLPIPGCHVFLAVLSGSGVLDLPDGHYHAGPGDTLLFDASTAPFSYGSCENEWNFWWFEFRCPDPLSLGIPMDEIVHHPLTGLQQALCAKALSRLKLQDRPAASSLLGSLLALMEPAAAPRESPAGENDLFRRADAYIRSNLATVTVASAAAHLQISERTLLSVFRSLLDLSTAQYIQMVRTDYARHLLLTSSSSVRRISELLGYADPFVFCKSFRRRFGLSPSQYRLKFQSPGSRQKASPN